MSEIYPITFTGLNCYTSCIISILNGINVKYQYLFADLCYFPISLFLPDFYSDIGSLSYYAYMYDHVFKSIIKKEAMELDISEYILRNIKEHKPILISIDHCLLNWSYQRIPNNKHCIIIYDINTITKEYICSDPTHNIKAGNIPCDFLLKNIIEINDDTFLTRLQDINNFTTKKRQNVPINIQDIEIQQKLSDFGSQEIINRFQIMTDMRSLFAKFLEETLSTEETVTDYYYLGSQWNTLKNMIYKYSLTRSPKVISSIQGKLVETLDLENKNSKLIDNKNKEKAKSLPLFDKVYYTVSIEEFKNNKGFGTTEYCDLPEFNNFGGFFSEDFPKNNMITLGLLAFNVSYFKNKDNIQCNGQTIEINGKNVAAIHFLACAEWGACIEILNIIDYLGYLHKKSIKVPDWRYEPEFNAKSAWRCRSIILAANEPLVSHYNRSIFHIEIPFQQLIDIKSISLPINLNLHIWSILIESAII